MIVACIDCCAVPRADLRRMDASLAMCKPAWQWRPVMQIAEAGTACQLLNIDATSCHSSRLSRGSREGYGRLAATLALACTFTRHVSKRLCIRVFFMCRASNYSICARWARGRRRWTCSPRRTSLAAAAQPTRCSQGWRTARRAWRRLTAQVRPHGWAWRQARRPWPWRAKQRGSGKSFRVKVRTWDGGRSCADHDRAGACPGHGESVKCEL